MSRVILCLIYLISIDYVGVFGKSTESFKAPRFFWVAKSISYNSHITLVEIFRISPRLRSNVV